MHRYANIREGLLPFEMSINGYNVRDAIELCQKAYANVSIFRNAVDIMSEFSNAEITLEGGSSKAQDFSQVDEIRKNVESKRSVLQRVLS